MFRENAVKGENSLDGDYFLAEVRGDFVNNVKQYEDNNRFLEGFENDPSIESDMAKHLSLAMHTIILQINIIFIIVLYTAPILVRLSYVLS